MKILVAVDGSAYTQRVLDYLAAHAELFGPQHDYTVIHVVAALPRYVSQYIDRVTLDEYHASQAKSVLEPVLDFAAQHGWSLSVLHPIGHAADLIAAAATEGAYDLLVMGSHGHTALANLLLGSVVSRVMALCSTALLIVR